MTDKKPCRFFILSKRNIWWIDLTFIISIIILSLLSVAEGCSTPTGNVGQFEKRRRLVQTRQAYDEWNGKAFFAFMGHLAYDLEGLAAGAGQMRPRRQSRGGSLPAPRKASNLERNSTSTCSERMCELNLQIKYDSTPQKYTYNKPICQNNKTLKIRKILIN
jgi:hypothetical protein